MMIKKLFLVLLLLFLLSCSNKKIEYNANGNKIKEYELTDNNIYRLCKEYYNNGNLKTIYNYKKGIELDSAVIYNTNGEIQRIDKLLQNDTIYSKEFIDGILESEGKYINRKNAIGKWRYYKKNGNLDKINEYINLCGNSYLNQGWYFDDKGDTIKKYGNYYEIKYFPKRIKKNEKVLFQVTYKPIIYFNSDVMVCFDAENKSTGDFCNIHQLKLVEAYKSSDVLKINITFENRGIKHFRGYIKEFFNKEPTKQDSITSGERFIYFDIPIKVE